MKQIKSTVILAASILGSVFLLCEPELAAHELKNGISICADTIIPSLFPFLLLSSFLTASGGAGRLSKLMSGICGGAFALSGACGSVILMGLVGGYPTGAKMAQRMYETGEIPQTEAKRLLWFCVNPGPSFVIGAVGINLFGGKKAGVIIYISVLLSSVIIGIASGIIKRIRFRKQQDEAPPSIAEPYPVEIHCSVAEAFVTAVANASTAMLSICAWALAFQVIISWFSLLDIPSVPEAMIGALLEITLGLSSTPGSLSLPTAAFLLAFGGVCVHFQVMSSVIAAKMKYSEFFLARLISGILSALICALLTRILPFETAVFSTGSMAVPQALSLSFPAACALLLTCSIFLLEQRS